MHPSQAEAPYQARGRETVAAGPWASVNGTSRPLVLRASAWLPIAVRPAVARTSSASRPPLPLSPPGWALYSLQLGLAGTAPGAVQDARGGARGEAEVGAGVWPLHVGGGWLDAWLPPPPPRLLFPRGLGCLTAR